MRAWKRIAAALLAVLLLAGAMPASVHADGGKLIALTFDDGPAGKNTARLLDGLKERGARCTFFLVGSSASGDPAAVRRMWREGHEIASHTYDHPALTGESSAAIKSQLERTDAVLDAALGMDLDYMLRPPYGDYNARVLEAANVPCFYWSMDTYDWQSRNADSVYREFIKQARDGSIALLHDTHATSVTAALRAIDTLQTQGYEFVTLSEMFMRRGTALAGGSIYFNAYPKDGQSTASGIGKPVVTVKDSVEGKLVTISGCDKRASVYYTLDGSMPAPGGSIKYSGPFCVTKDTVVRAQAVVKWNGIRSSETTAKIEYSPAASPEFSLEDGMLTFTCATAGARLYYTSDGTVPDETSDEYTAPFAPVPGTDYRVRAYAPAHDAGLVACVTYSDRGNLFADVHTDDWFYEAADRSAAAGLFVGVASNTFAPGLSLSRAMLVTALYRLAGQPDTEGLSLPFSDAPAAGSWSCDAFRWAYGCGIILGCGNGRVEPYRDISRQELCSVAARYMEWTGRELGGLDYVLDDFVDGEKIPESVRGEVNAVCALGIVQGFPGGRIAPAEGATRAQAAAITERMKDVLLTLPDKA